MKLRPELLPITLDQDLIRRLSCLADQLDGCNSDFQDCESLLQQFNFEAGTDLQMADFHFSGSVDADTFVQQLLTPKPLVITDISREEFVELLTRVSTASGNEVEIGYWLELLALNLSEPKISDLIFWPDAYFAPEPVPDDLSPQSMLEIVLQAKHRRIFAMSPSSE